jgi:hypothetical protein
VQSHGRNDVLHGARSPRGRSCRRCSHREENIRGVVVGSGAVGGVLIMEKL